MSVLKPCKDWALMYQRDPGDFPSWRLRLLHLDAVVEITPSGHYLWAIYRSVDTYLGPDTEVTSSDAGAPARDLDHAKLQAEAALRRIARAIFALIGDDE